LVVAFACAAVRNELAAFLLGDCDLGAGDDWAGEGGSKQVDVLVACVRLDSGEAELLHELVDHVLLFRRRVVRAVIPLFPGLREEYRTYNIALLGPDLQCLCFGGFEVLLLANVGHEADHFIALLDKPSEND